MSRIDKWMRAHLNAIVCTDRERSYLFTLTNRSSENHIVVRYMLSIIQPLFDLVSNLSTRKTSIHLVISVIIICLGVTL